MDAFLGRAVTNDDRSMVRMAGGAIAGRFADGMLVVIIVTGAHGDALLDVGSCSNLIGSDLMSSFEDDDEARPANASRA